MGAHASIQTVAATVIARHIIRRKRPFFAGLCSSWRTRLWEAKDVFRSSDLHK